MVLNFIRRCPAIMSDERLHLLMRYSYWNELCARGRTRHAAGALF